jgi:L-gulonate 3-dehydrogenase
MRVVIIGCGIIGRCWTVLFARAKHDVYLFDTMPSMLELALADIRRQLEQLEQFDLLFHQTSTQVHERIRTIETMSQLNDLFNETIDHVQECIPEDVAIKTAFFLELDRKVPSNVLIASSSSCIVPSKFTEHMATRHRCIVA